MHKNRNNRGFTLAEMLIVVAIIIILSGVAFVAVASHQRSMALLERDAVAQEIFVAAQNHLTMAESQGYLPSTVGGNVVAGKSAGSESTDMELAYDTYYFTSDDLGDGTLLDLMLPFGSIDETIRSGGSYIIRYQAKPAIVLDVFYCPHSTSANGQLRYGHNLGGNTYSELKGYAGADKREARKNCLSDNCVLGWYGGAGAEDSGSYIEAPEITVYNKERLTVHITDPNSGKPVSSTDSTALASLMLIVTGEDSHAQAAILLTSTGYPVNRVIPDDDFTGYTIVLDDITQQTASTGINDGLHFADLNKYASDSGNAALMLKKVSGTAVPFKPGENITVQAVAYSNKALTNIAYSAERTTNSLFADPGDAATTAMIENFRHLENLDADISGLDSTLGYNRAEQIADLAWKPSTGSTLEVTDFVSAIKTEKGTTNPVKVYKLNDTTGTKGGCYLPVDIGTSAFTYEGNCHKVFNLAVDATGTGSTPIDKGGMFGAFGNASGTAGALQNLELIDFSVKLGSGDAGALAGATTNTAVTNVLARNTTSATFSAAAPNITTASGNAGGLIGNVTNGSVTNSAAAQIVSGTTNAGGLIGLNSAGKISGCYSGGHTQGGVYTDAICYDVTAASGIAGGLIGTSSAAEIRNSYSTCSVKSATAGGFVGKLMSTSEIYGCYCTGRVDGTTEGAFVGLLDTTTGASESCFKVETVNGKEKKCMYFEIINARPGDVSHPYLTALGNNGTTDNIALVDADATSYNTFVGASGNWKQAAYYDTARDDYYRTDADSEDAQTARYSLRTVAQLGATVNETATATTPADFVSVHYGDWPAPETYVLNSAG